MRLCLLFVAALLSGCVSGTVLPPSRDSAAPSLDASAPGFPWALADCREIIAFFDVDPAIVGPLLPEGFAPGGGTVPGKTTAGIDAFHCASGAGSQGNVSDASYASFWVNAVAPEALRGEAQATFVKWDALAIDPTVLAALRAANVSARSGKVDIAEAAVAGAGASGTIALDELGSVSLTLLPGLPQRSAAASSTSFQEHLAKAERGVMDVFARFLRGP